LYAKSAALPKTAQDGLTRQMALVLAARMAAEVNRLGSIPNGKRRSEMWSKLLGNLAVLRRGEFHGERLEVEREKLDFRRQRHQQEREAEFWQWTEKGEHRDQILTRLLSPEQRNEEIARSNVEELKKMKAALGLK
jgi:hypothetical protein